MRLQVITRTHDGANVHANGRFLDASKPEIIFRCLRSLVNTVNKLSDVEVSLIVVDDHSTPETIKQIREIIGEKTGSELVQMESTGNGSSMKKCYDIALTSGAELIYFCEDDWLHQEDALPKMLVAWQDFTRLSGNASVSISPGDCWWDYIPDRIKPCRLAISSDHHWRTNDYTTFVVLCTRWTLMHHWELFQKFTKYDSKTVVEDNTINLMYGNRQDRVWLFNPVPAFAVHLADKIAPAIDWKQLWDSNN